MLSFVKLFNFMLLNPVTFLPMYWVYYSIPNYNSKHNLVVKYVINIDKRNTFEAYLLFLVSNKKADDQNKEDKEEGEDSSNNRGHGHGICWRENT